MSFVIKTARKASWPRNPKGRQRGPHLEPSKDSCGPRNATSPTVWIWEISPKKANPINISYRSLFQSLPRLLFVPKLASLISCWERREQRMERDRDEHANQSSMGAATPRWDFYGLASSFLPLFLVIHLVPILLSFMEFFNFCVCEWMLCSYVHSVNGLVIHWISES